MSDSRKCRTGFEMSIGQGPQQGKTSTQDPQGHLPDTDPFCIAVLGDFSGRENSQRYETDNIRQRRFINIDRDNLDDVLAGFKIRLQLWLDDDAEEPIEVPINELDDFHPDQLFQNIEIFSQLRSLQTRLKNNKTFTDAARELQACLGETEPEDKQDKQPTAKTGQTDDLLNSVLASSQGEQTGSNTRTVVDKLVKQIVAPYVEPRADPRQKDMLTAVEQAIAAHMQFILHHPDFQAMESAWRSLDFITRRIETGRSIKIYLMDVALHELEVDLEDDNVTKSGFYQKFCDPAPGDIPWGIMIGNYRFRDRVEDIMTLLNIGAVARKAQAPFISAVYETLIGCESFAVTPDVDDWNYELEPEVQTAWSLLRNADEAEYLSLVMPGFLLRSPYGKKARSIESFAFEEMPEVHCHSCYLWGNGAFLKAEQLARAFSQQGWDMNPLEAREVGQLPLHLYEQDGEQTAKPCAEIQLTEKGGQRILQQGLIPIWSVKNCDAVRSSDFHSLAR